MLNKLVIKVGGAFMHDQNAAFALLRVISQLQQRYIIVLVHGGGDIVEKLLTALNLTSEKVDGLRITPTEHIPFITGALAGTANKQLCALAIKAGIRPVGLSLLDGDICTTSVLNQTLGAVGVAKPKDASLLKMLAATQWLPVISSIGADDQGNLYNVNADQAATVIAQLLDADLFLLSDVTGVLDAKEQLLTELTPEHIKQLIEQQVIRDGMVVKVHAALEAATSLGRPVIIASWKKPQGLLSLLNNGSIGSKIYPNTSTTNKVLA